MRIIDKKLAIDRSESNYTWLLKKIIFFMMLGIKPRHSITETHTQSKSHYINFQKWIISLEFLRIKLFHFSAMS
jgi:hypothetical protein